MGNIESNEWDSEIETLIYKGFRSRPSYDARLSCYIGYIEGTDVYYEWRSLTLENCRLEFQKAVDEYLEFVQACKDGKFHIAEDI